MVIYLLIANFSLQQQQLLAALTQMKNKNKNKNIYVVVWRFCVMLLSLQYPHCVQTQASHTSGIFFSLCLTLVVVCFCYSTSISTAHKIRFDEAHVSSGCDNWQLSVCTNERASQFGRGKYISPRHTQDWYVCKWKTACERPHSLSLAYIWVWSAYSIRTQMCDVACEWSRAQKHTQHLILYYSMYIFSINVVTSR